MTASDGPVGAERSLGALVATATSELSELVHDEIALAKAEVRRDVKRAVVGGGAFAAAGALLVFSLPMLSFALAEGIRVWSHWPMWACYLLSFAGSVLVALLCALIGLLFVKKARRSRGPQRAIASAKETASVLHNVKPHPRTVLPAPVPGARPGQTPGGRAEPGPAAERGPAERGPAQSRQAQTRAGGADDATVARS